MPVIEQKLLIKAPIEVCFDHAEIAKKTNQTFD
jgi:hypothetical protein